MPDELTPSKFVIAMKGYSAGPALSDVRVTLSSLDLRRLVRGRLRPGETRHVLAPESRFIEAPEAWGRFKKSMTVVAEDPSPRKLLAMVDALRRCASDYLFTPEAAGDGTIAIMAASLGVPVRLACREDWSEAVLANLLDYFLHSPALAVPIEPIYSLAGAIGQQHQVTLWQLFDEALGRNYFIDSEQRVSLAERWAERGLFFGNLSEGQNGFKDSKLWADLDGLKQRLFAARTPCAFCEHYPYCAGFWTTARRADETCAMWRRLMDRLAAAYKQELIRTREPAGVQEQGNA